MSMWKSEKQCARSPWFTVVKLASWLPILLSAACQRDNPLFCQGHPDDPYCMDAASNACSSSAQCSAPTAVCDLTTMTCVQCTTAEAAACTGTTPACVANQCEKCAEHAQCPASNACLPDGACAEADSVAYVQAGGSGTACTKAAPCGTLDDALKANKPTVKIAAGTVTDTNTTLIEGKAVTILADPGAKLDRSGDGIILEVKGTGADVKILDLEISGGTGLATDPAISMPSGGSPKLALTRVKVTGNQGVGISSSGGTLTVSQSTVSGNTGGGISISGGQFVLVGNMLFGNGSTASTTGGVTILTTQSPANRLEFNSFNKNQAQDGIGAAIQCTAGTFAARNNIMSGNGTLTNQEQTGGPCSHAYSIATPGTVPPGATNAAKDPLFKNTTTGDLHLQGGSPAIRAADPGSDLGGIAAHDLDGDVRLSPADIGADQLPR